MGKLLKCNDCGFNADSSEFDNSGGILGSAIGSAECPRCGSSDVDEAPPQ